MLSPIQDDVKLIQDECKAILGLDTATIPLVYRWYIFGILLISLRASLRFLFAGLPRSRNVQRKRMDVQGKSNCIP